jgi:hypothetical protein
VELRAFKNPLELPADLFNGWFGCLIGMGFHRRDSLFDHVVMSGEAQLTV